MVMGEYGDGEWGGREKEGDKGQAERTSPRQPKKDHSLFQGKRTVCTLSSTWVFDRLCIDSFFQFSSSGSTIP